ncbi:MAG: hypothetical protein AAF405_07390 [Pseudomonadota bacterium]
MTKEAAWTLTSRLVLVSGWIEIAFGVAAIFAPSLVVAAVGATGLDGATVALIRLLGVATFAIGVGALLGRKWSGAAGCHNTAYGLGSYAAICLAIYNILAAPALLIGAMEMGSLTLWAGGGLHLVIALLFIYAISVARR